MFVSRPGPRLLREGGGGKATTVWLNDRVFGLTSGLSRLVKCGNGVRSSQSFPLFACPILCYNRRPGTSGMLTAEGLTYSQGRGPKCYTFQHSIQTAVVQSWCSRYTTPAMRNVGVNAISAKTYKFELGCLRRSLPMRRSADPCRGGKSGRGSKRGNEGKTGGRKN